MASQASASVFEQQTLELLSRLEVREAVLPSEKDQIGELRRLAYLQPSAAKGAGTLADGHDGDENGRTYGLYCDGRLASSIRIHVASPGHPACPAMDVFSDCLTPMLERGMVLVDPTRVVMDSQSLRANPMLPYATIRIAWMACEHFAASMFLATAGAQNEAFYKRLFGHGAISPARPHSVLSAPVRLMVINFSEERARLLRRYPFLRSTDAERRAVFEPAWRPLHRQDLSDAWTPSFSPPGIGRISRPSML